MKVFIIAAICLQVALATPVTRSPYEGDEFEGDIVLNEKQRNGRSQEIYRWRNGVVPYVIEGSYNSEQLEKIHSAMQHLQENTCIRFVPKEPTHHDYIAITNAGDGCSSSVGRLGIGRQQVTLANNCLTGTLIGTPVHEFMHAIGFWHEQSRVERDNYLTIHLENVEDKMEHNFNKKTQATTYDMGVKYDYNSVMHYGRYFFSKNKEQTMEAKKPVFIGHSFGLSTGDIIKIKNMYALECNNW